MKVEIRCPACGRGYLVDEAKIPPTGGKVSCKACGGAIDLPAHRAPAGRPSPAPSAPPEDASGPAVPAGGKVVCPRCGLHFSLAQAGPAARGASRPTVLVVEDMDYFLEIAKDALSQKYEVKVARSLEEARRALSAGRIDAILLDLTLKNGEEGLALIREMPCKPCPVVIFTAADETEMYGDSWARLRALGVDDLVIKGINVGESLARKIGVLLGEPEPEETPGR